MIEEARQLEGFLPISYRTAKEEEYVRFLWEAFNDNCASSKHQFADASDQEREVLINEGYMSLIDLDFCANLDIAELADHPHFAEIEALHAEVKTWVASEEALAA